MNLYEVHYERYSSSFHVLIAARTPRQMLEQFEKYTKKVYHTSAEITSVIRTHTKIQVAK